MENANAIEYTVNGAGFATLSAATKHAHAIRAEVIDARNGRRVWYPAPLRKAKRAHVLVHADGTETPIGKVRNGGAA